ncbi:helix-turn-helix transcriptional regulator [Enterococcus mediterraneensis]|uniref:helix-turn-helix transcriptional regulator n=1 Tax=Enterococcus mediterraneensis TaxID=2364791 RepID=UPI000F046C36|nr:helix-turn-helix transcriptional regulator [Enterococcus mediterraneensis]
MELNERLKKLRIAHQLTQEELAQKIFVSRQTISNWENGKGQPELENLLLLSELYQISINELLQTKQLTAPPENQRIAKQHLYGLSFFSFMIIVLQITIKPYSFVFLLAYSIGGLLWTSIYLFRTKRLANIYGQGENMYDVAIYLWIASVVGFFVAILLQGAYISN